MLVKLFFSNFIFSSSWSVSLAWGWKRKNKVRCQVSDTLQPPTMRSVLRVLCFMISLMIMFWNSLNRCWWARVCFVCENFIIFLGHPNLYFAYFTHKSHSGYVVLSDNSDPSSHFGTHLGFVVGGTSSNMINLKMCVIIFCFGNHILCMYMSRDYVPFFSKSTLFLQLSFCLFTYIYSRWTWTWMRRSNNL